MLIAVLLIVAGAATPLDIHVHETLGHELHHLAQHIDIGALLSKLGKCHSSGGHCDFPFDQVGGSHLNLIRIHDDHPKTDGPTELQAASGYALRALQLGQ